jgi:hypothetical protein
MVDANLEVGRQQFEIMKDAEETLQRATGVYQAMLGSAEQGTTSGIAINSLVEQGTTTLAEINDNYRYSRRAVGEALVNLIRDDIAGQQVNVVVGEDASKRIISLNVPQQDPATGMTFLANDTERSQVKVALEDVPSTPAYRAQQAAMLTQVMQSLAPEFRLMPFYIESTELPQRKKIVATLKKVLNLPDVDYQPGQDPEKDALMQQVQALTQQLEQLSQSPELAKAQAAAQELAAGAKEKEARAEKIRAEVSRMGLEDEQQRIALMSGAQESPAEADLRAQVADLTIEYQGAVSDVEQAKRESEQAAQALRAELAKAQQEAADKVSIADIELRKAQIEADTRRAEADAEIRKAEIEAESRGKSEDIFKSLGAQLEPIFAKIEKLQQAIYASEKTEPKEAAELPAITIPVNVTVEKSGNRTATIKKQADGSYKADVVEDE